MKKCLTTLALLLTFCLGCNDAAMQQKNDQAQQSAVASELKEQGEAMQNAEVADPAAVITEEVKP